MVWSRLAAPALFDPAVPTVEPVLCGVVLGGLGELLVVFVLDAPQIACLAFGELELGFTLAADCEVRNQDHKFSV